MRILFVTNAYPRPENEGDSPCIEQQRQALCRLGHAVDILFVNGRRSRLNYLRGLAQVFLAAQLRGGYDVVHGHYGYCGIVARAQCHCPTVVTYRGSDVMSKNQRWLSQILARFVNQSIVMTEEMRAVLGRSDALVIPYGVDLEVYHPLPVDDARRELGLALGVPLVLFPYDTARRVKRFDLVEAAMGILQADIPDARVLTVHGKPPRVLSAYMSACDATVLSSDTEGSPVAIREAMACNLPIVSVDVGDVREVIAGVQGCYLAERDPADIAAKLSLVLRERRRTNGRSVAELLSTDRSALAVAEVYGRLVTRHPQGRRRVGS